ncbi:MAG: hypothetical protein KJ626_07945 [Verrucomicrobia bacterium]|nr:hypothetical protein [Verrucomicrobiota bacterium]
MDGRFSERLLTWLVPLIVLAVLLTCSLLAQKSSGLMHSFADDSTYLDLTFARSLAEYHAHFIDSATPVPALRNALWRGLVAVISLGAGNQISAAYMLATICSMITVCVFVSLARRLLPEEMGALGAAAIFVASPFLVATVLVGSEVILSATLVLGAFALYLRGMEKSETVLPASAAWLIGLAMWIRLEFAVVWVVLSIHGIVCSAFGAKGEKRVALAVVRSLSGVCVLALLTLPLLAQNLWLLRVPWPRLPSGALSLDAMGQAALSGTYLELAKGSMLRACGSLWGNAGIGGKVVGILAAFGMGVLTVTAIRRKELRMWSTLPALLLAIPPLTALVSLLLGDGGVEVVVSSLIPLVLLSFAFGVMLIPCGLETLFRKSGGLPKFLSGRILCVAVTVILVLFMLGLQVDAVKTASARIRDAASAAGILRERLAPDPLDGKEYVTDKVGRLAYECRTRMIDLSGESTPFILTCINPGGGLDYGRVAAGMRKRSGDVLILWSDNHQELLNHVAAHELELGQTDASVSMPRVWVID